MTLEHVSGTCSTAGWHKDMYLINKPLLADTRTYNVSGTYLCCVNQQWNMLRVHVSLLYVQGHFTSTCSTGEWHKDMSLEHVLLLADIRTCLRYMPDCLLTQGHLSCNVQCTYSTGDWQKDLYCYRHMFHCWLYKNISLEHVPLLAVTRLCLWFLLYYWLNHVPLVADKRTCTVIWHMFHFWLYKDMLLLLVHVLLLADTRTSSTAGI